jgi:molybdopterin-containing oxidoreductase family iron-sulfur binding subunit
MSQATADSVAIVVSRRDLVQRLFGAGAGALATALAGGAGVAVLTSVPPARAATPDGAPPNVKRKYRYGMVIDTRRCVGCRACVVACKAENKTPPGVFYNRVLEDAFPVRDDRPVFATKPCFHCEKPPCVEPCPVDPPATYKRDRDGLVVIDYDRCIGCGACVGACPYDSRTLDGGDNYPAVAANTPWARVPSPEYLQYRVRRAGHPPIERARKCTFCLHLQDAAGRYDKAAGRWPACAKTCTGHAIAFGDFNDPQSEVSKLLRERKPVRLKEELGTEPNVHYLL